MEMITYPNLKKDTLWAENNLEQKSNKFIKCFRLEVEAWF